MLSILNIQIYKNRFYNAIKFIAVRDKTAVGEGEEFSRILVHLLEYDQY